MESLTSESKAVKRKRGRADEDTRLSMVRNYRKAMTFITSTWASGEHGPLAACVPAGMVSARERLALNRCSDRLFAVYIYTNVPHCFHAYQDGPVGWVGKTSTAGMCTCVYKCIYIYKSASRNLDNKIMCYWH